MEHLVVIAHNRLPWPLIKRCIRLVEFEDGTYALGWRWSKRLWNVERT